MSSSRCDSMRSSTRNVWSYTSRKCVIAALPMHGASPRRSCESTSRSGPTERRKATTDAPQCEDLLRRRHRCRPEHQVFHRFEAVVDGGRDGEVVVDDHIEDRPEEEAFVLRVRIEALALEAGLGLLDRAGEVLVSVVAHREEPALAEDDIDLVVLQLVVDRTRARATRRGDGLRAVRAWCAVRPSGDLRRSEGGCAARPRGSRSRASSAS